MFKRRVGAHGNGNGGRGNVPTGGSTAVAALVVVVAAGVDAVQKLPVFLDLHFFSVTTTTFVVVVVVKQRERHGIEALLAMGAPPHYYDCIAG